MNTRRLTDKQFYALGYLVESYQRQPRVYSGRELAKQGYRQNTYMSLVNAKPHALVSYAPVAGAVTFKPTSAGSALFREEQTRREGKGTPKSETPIFDYPQDLTTLTPEQTEAAIAYLVSLPLKELRQRQDILHGQQRSAAKMTESDVTARAINNLAVMEDHLMEAIDRQVFGE